MILEEKKDRSDIRFWWDNSTKEEKLNEFRLRYFNKEFFDKKWDELPEDVQDHLILLLP